MSHRFHLFKEGLFPFLPDSPLQPIFFPRFLPAILSHAKNIPVVPNLISNPIDGLFQNSLLQLALPNNNDTPTQSLQLPPYLLIPFLIPSNFGYPEFRVCFRYRIILTAFMTMPKAAMNEDSRPIFGKYNIRSPGKSLVVYPIAESMAPQCMTQPLFRFIGGGTNCSHVAMALNN